MSVPTRPPPRVLLIHDSNPVDAYIDFLKTAGLVATEAPAADSVARAAAERPDIIVLDFDCNGEIVAALQADVRTRGIPVIALADLVSLRRPENKDRA